MRHKRHTRATTLGLSFSNRRGPRIGREQLSYVVFHGLARAFRPELPRGRTCTGQLPPEALPGGWVTLDNGDRCRAVGGRFTFLDVPPGKHGLWADARGPGGRLSMTIQVP